jgi:hypothetical protein
LSEPAALPEGARMLVTLLSDEVAHFWMSASQKSLDEVWNNDANDVYGELLEK